MDNEQPEYCTEGAQSKRCMLTNTFVPNETVGPGGQSNFVGDHSGVEKAT
jgi:hypothetical protein